VQILLVNGTSLPPSPIHFISNEQTCSLKTTLNLPSIEPRPPCPPKIYKKLYGHFDKILISTSSRRRARSSTNSTPAKSLPQKHAPAKEKSLEGFRSNRTPKRGLKYASNKEKGKLPKWVGPAIRKICTEFDAGKAVPHVWAGVESVLYLPCPKDMDGDENMQEGKMEGKLPALVAAVWFYAVTRMTGKETNKKDLFEWKKGVLRILRGLKEDEVMLAKVGDEEESWESWEHVSMTNLNNWISEIIEKGWSEMDWYTNIEAGSGASGRVDVEDEDEDEEDEEVMERSSKRVLRAGLGTMMQPKFDYLSDEKRDEYAVWKEAMLAKIDDLVTRGIMDETMDTTEG
jgi:origin recognition complex subunit 6